MTHELKLAETLGDQLKKDNLKLAVAESCTGGSLASTLTAIANSSQWFDRGFVTYSNEAKKEILNVSEQTLQFDGAVSEATVRAMAEGAIHYSDAHLSVAISGIAGPGGGTPEKPVGTVWIAFAGLKQPTSAHYYTFQGSRAAVREAAVIEALKGLIQRTRAYAKPLSQAARYFFALWPDASTQNTLYETAQTITQQTPCTPTLANNLHLTLAYLGTLTDNEYHVLKTFHCAITPFELKINTASHWPKPNIAYFGPTPEKPLHALHTCLNQHLLEKGFKPERQQFIPHITLARHYTHPLTCHLPSPIHWFVHEVCLVKSTPEQGVSHYEIMARTPLPLKTC